MYDIFFVLTYGVSIHVTNMFESECRMFHICFVSVFSLLAALPSRLLVFSSSRPLAPSSFRLFALTSPCALPTPDIVLLLLLVIYMFAILGRTLFGENDPHHFGGIPEAMLYLFQVWCGVV